ncbi:hypothetical protein R1flu_008845 [Riccia fluitans]|uniref:Deoxynucleoside kinase domain-containing protein n=1 Tax=Riccia fluitans TaxID=41844 RepID=A0ABD1Z0K3_9MARC
MRRVHRLLQFRVTSCGATLPKMPALTSLNSAVGAFCCSVTDSQARALSFGRIKAIQAPRLDFSARNPSHLASTVRPYTSTECSIQAFCDARHCLPKSPSVQYWNPGRDAVQSEGLSLLRGARHGQHGVPVREVKGEQRRIMLSYLRNVSLRSLYTSSEKKWVSRSSRGPNRLAQVSGVQRLSSRRSFSGTSCGSIFTLKGGLACSRDLHTGYLTCSLDNEGSQRLGGETVQSDNSSLLEGNSYIAEDSRCNDNSSETLTKVVEQGVDTGSDSEALVGVPSNRVRCLTERRRRSASSSNRSGSEFRDLLTVPGIGRRNMEKLVAKGIAKVDELKQLYRDKYRSHGAEKMVEFLRSSVGVHKHHAASITDFIKTSVEKEDGGTESGYSSKKRLTFCVEGNISVGKTTFLHRIANETIELRDLVEIVPEPISKWQDVGPDHFNILDAFYGDPERYAYTFQNYVFVTRMMQERESAHGEKKLRLMERSVFSDRMVFVRAVHEAKWMSDAEISIYDSWFDPVVSAMPGLVPDAFIYLRATPDTCHRRLQSRKRKEEDTVTLDYLRGLHEKHEQWLFPAEHGGRNVLSVTDWASSERGLPLSPRLRDRVLYLKGENVHSSIQKVPALILDCEPSIDFTQDIEAKAEYARQVADFFNYVQALKDGQSNAEGGSGTLVLPASNGLLGPDGNTLKNTSLDGMDFRRHMSAVC